MRSGLTLTLILTLTLSPSLSLSLALSLSLTLTLTRWDLERVLDDFVFITFVVGTRPWP